MNTATVTVAPSTPTRTADYGPAPAGHAKAGRQVGGKGRKRPARWSRILRAGSTFLVDALELEALEAWLARNPSAAGSVKIRRLPPASVVLETVADVADKVGDAAAALGAAPAAAVAEAVETAAEAAADAAGELEGDGQAAARKRRRAERG